MYKEIVIIIHTNDRVKFGELVEEAILQNYVPYGDFQYGDMESEYVLMMIKYTLAEGIKAGQDLRPILVEFRKSVQHQRSKDQEKQHVESGSDPVPFGA